MKKIIYTPIIALITIFVACIFYNHGTVFALSPGDNVKDQIEYAIIDSHEDHWLPGHSWYSTFFNIRLKLVPGSWLQGYEEAKNLWNEYTWQCVEARVWWPPEGVQVRVAWATVQSIDNGNVQILVHLDPDDGTQDVEGTIYVHLVDAEFLSQTHARVYDSTGKEQAAADTNWDSGIEMGSVTVNQGSQDTGSVYFSFWHTLHRFDGNGWTIPSWWDVPALRQRKGRADENWNVAQGENWFNAGGVVDGLASEDRVREEVELGSTIRVCRWLHHSRRVTMISQNGIVVDWHDGEKTSSGICANVAHPYNFQLNDAIELKGENVVYTGQTAEAGYYLYNRDEDKPRTDIAHTASPTDTKTRKIWFLTNELDANKLQGGIEHTDDEASICNHFKNEGVTMDGCDIEQLRADESIQPDESRGGTPFYDTTTFNVPDIDPASGMNKFCVATAVNPSSSKSDGDGTEVNHEWVVSNASCRTIAKKPLIDFKMGNVYSAGGIKTSISTKTNNITYGSWAEYLAISNNDISHFASGAQIAGGSTLGPDICNYAPLSIANVQCQKSAAAGAVGQSNAKNEGKFLNQIMGLYENEGADIHSTDEWGPNIYIIHPRNGDFEIKNDIIVNGTYERASDVPQYIIIADNIKIDPGVTRVDAWLIATGTKKDGQYLGGRIETCAGSKIGPMNIDNCAADLQINGPILAKNMTSNRTAGAGTMASGTSAWPGEILNLTPAAYEWAYSQASGSEQSQSHTVYTRELAPRL